MQKDRPSPSLDPAMLASHYEALGQDDPVLQSIEAGFKRLQGTMQSIYDAKQKNAENPMQTALANAKATADYTAKTSVPALTTAQASIDSATSAVQKLERQINEPLNRKGKHDAETRSLLRELKHEERRRFLSDAISANDTAALSAVLTAPPYLSGIDKAAAESFRQQYHRKNNPVALDRIKFINNAIELLDRAGLVFGNECGKLMHPEGLAKARHLEKMALEASSA